MQAARALQRKRVTSILRRLRILFPKAKIMLKYSNPLELLVAVMLSAQCTDTMVNKVTEKLFKKYRILDDYIDVSLKDLERDIFSTGFYHMKARHIKAAATMIRQRFGGQVPSRMDDMLQLPGVARKTANVVLGNAFGVVDGIAVDTHVKRLSRLLGLTENTDPNKIEKDLMEVVPKRDWLSCTYLLIEYGRKYCRARKHNHAKCPLYTFHSLTH